MARKNAVRTIVTFVCSACSAYSYHSEKNKRNDPDRIELKKFCRVCRSRNTFKEKR